MNELIIKEKVEDMIYEMRDTQVMLDSDLAKLYNVETKRINEAVRRNKEKFPERFTFVLTDEESNNFLVANCDQKRETRGGKYKNPRVFTEQGVTMLATILKSKIAIEVSIRIVDAFVFARKYISNSDLRISNIETKIIDHDSKIKLLQKSFNELNKKSKKESIFFKGQIYDAYSLIVDILKKSDDEIIIIDNYVDKSILDITSLLNKNVIIVTKKFNNIDVQKYGKQYDNLNIVINNSFHDRFIILDRKELYHCGASFKDLGSKCFAINKLEDDNILKELLKKIEQQINFS